MATLSSFSSNQTYPHTYTTYAYWVCTCIETYPYCTHFTPVWYRLLCMPPTLFLTNSYKWRASYNHGLTVGSWMHNTILLLQNQLERLIPRPPSPHRLQVIEFLTGTRARLTCKSTTLPYILTKFFSLLSVERLAPDVCCAIGDHHGQGLHSVWPKFNKQH